MQSYLVEHYWPGVTESAFGAAVASVRAGAEALAREGKRVRYVRSTLVPKDELGICVLAAESQALVEEAYARAGVAYHRIVESVEVLQ